LNQKNTAGIVFGNSKTWTGKKDSAQVRTRKNSSPEALVKKNFLDEKNGQRVQTREKALRKGVFERRMAQAG